MRHWCTLCRSHFAPELISSGLPPHNDHCERCDPERYQARLRSSFPPAASRVNSGRDGSRPGSLLAVAYVDRSTSAESKDAQS